MATLDELLNGPRRTKPLRRFDGYTFESGLDVLQRLVSFRHELGISQKEFAVRMGVSAAVVSRLENALNRDTRPPTYNQLQAYARALDGDVQMAVFFPDSPDG